MPDFGHPFSGLAKERKLTDAELIRAIRFMVSAEYEAIHSTCSLPNQQTIATIRFSRMLQMKKVLRQGAPLPSERIGS